MYHNLKTIFWAICLTLCCGLQSSLSAEESETWSPRRYELGITTPEADDIKFIITTMGEVTNAVSYAKLYFKADELELRGARIDNLHPLWFLTCIFSDEQMKVSMHNVQKYLMWKKFLYGKNGDSGIANTLEEEANRGNLRPEHIHAFTSQLGVDFNKYNNLIQNRRWEAVVVALINDVPRKGDYRRNDY